MRTMEVEMNQHECQSQRRDCSTVVECVTICDSPGLHLCDACAREDRLFRAAAAIEPYLRDRGTHSDAMRDLSAAVAEDAAERMALLSAPPAAERGTGANPAPRYDEVFAEGTAWLNEMARSEPAERAETREDE